MTQAYPQFTPVQILEAGQRAMSEGRGEYATQFFQHLIDHYADTAEAAGARDAMARLGYTGDGNAQALPAPPSSSAHQNGAHAHAPTDGEGSPPRGMQLSLNGHPNARQPAGGNGARNGPDMGYGSASHQSGANQTMASRSLPDAYPQPSSASDMPRHIARHAAPNGNANPGVASQRGSARHPHRHVVPAPEKHYIIGRVISGLVLLIGIFGIFGGIILLYAAVTDPAIFTRIGLAAPAQALVVAGAVFIGSIVLLIASQVATAIFNASDAAADLVRLERYRAGGDDHDDA